jgi:probable rRNA maturation factor
MIEIDVENETAEPVDTGAIAGLVTSVLEAEGVVAAEASVLLVTAATMQRLNAEHRGLDEVTDVLAFPIDDGDDDLPDGAPRLLGDVVICLERCASQAAEQDVARGDELATLAVHGTLHLLGYDHEADDGEMLARQDALLDAVEPIGWSL